jgi:Protein of unknown function (DUF559)
VLAGRALLVDPVSMRPPAPLPEHMGDEPFTVSDAIRANVPPGRLRRGDLAQPYRGVRVERSPITIEDRCRAYIPLLRGDARFTHATAALLHGIPLPARLMADPEIHVGTSGTPPRGRRVHGHRVRAGTPVVLVRGLPVVPAEEAWCQLAEVLGVEDLVVAGDHLLRHGVRDVAATTERLHAAIGAVRRSGGELLQAALPLLRAGVRSPRESLLRIVLVTAGLPEPEVNVRLFRFDGTYLGEGDLVYRGARLVLEYEGDQHRTDPLQFRYDIRRREEFEDAGWSVLRVTGDDLFPHRPELVRRVAFRLRGNPRMQKMPPSRVG